MKAERIWLDEFLHWDLKDKQAVLNEIENGAVFVYPTETIYGVGGLTLGDFVYKRVLEIKRRPPENPFILIASNREFFSSLNPQFSSKTELLANRFWPGPLTMVLPCDTTQTEIALRVTDHPFTTEINRHFNLPLISTSANVSGEPYNGDPDYIFNLFETSVDFMFDAGWLPRSLPSTVIKSSGDSVQIIRLGAVTQEKIEKCLSVCAIDSSMF
jgi:L-threonylcarbamoyladenylate synthase